MKHLKIVIADDHEIVRRGIHELLTPNSSWKICGEAGTGADTLKLVRKHKPGVLILDINLPDRSGLEIARIVRQEYPATEVVILTMHESAEMASEALAAGARGLVYKSDAGRDLAGAIEAVGRKQTFLSAHVMKAIAKSGLPAAAKESGITRLTGREREILRMLAEGQTVKKVADQLGISHKTVQAHRANIMEKLHLFSSADIIYFALRNHLVELKS